MGPPEVEIMTAILLHPISPALSQEASALLVDLGTSLSYLSVSRERQSKSLLMLITYDSMIPTQVLEYLSP